MGFMRLSRMRSHKELRDMCAQTALSAKDLIMPYFVIGGRNTREPIASMPGISRLSADLLIEDVKELKGLGIDGILLFGVCGAKDETGSQGYSGTGIVQEAVRALKKDIPDMAVITDVCLCGYTTHGHCGIVKKGSRLKGQGSRGAVDIDLKETLDVLAKIAVSHAQAGADVVAPSAMMDGQVGAIRGAFDSHGFGETGILAYSAKYASSFYGPFRDALESAPQFGDRRSYQMDYRNSDEALREIGEDIAEGADMVMVKPALAYLDIVRRAKENFTVPLAAYNVSGEYSLVKAGAQAGFVQEKDMVLEILTGIKRAGADVIISYHAKEAARWLKE